MSSACSAPLGASRRQVIGSVVAEAAVIGIGASAIGLGVGYGLAALLLSLAGRLGFAIPTQTLVLEQRTVLAALGIGVLVTVAASLWPAIRAARVPPIVATTGAVLHRPRPLARRIVTGAALVAVGVPVLVVGLHRTRYQADVLREIGWVALGAVLIVFGVIVLLAVVAGPLAGMLGAPLRRAGMPGRLARDNAMRNPRRTAATASALVIGLALVGLVAIFGASAKTSVRQAVDGGIRADLVARRPRSSPASRRWSPTGWRRSRGSRPSPGSGSATCGSRSAATRRPSPAPSPPTSARSSTLGLRRGSVAGLGRDGVLVTEDASREYGLHVGDQVDMQFPQGIQTLRVAGIYTRDDFTGGFPVGFIVAEPAYEAGFGTATQDSLVYVEAGPGDTAAVETAVRAALATSFPNVDVLDPRPVPGQPAGRDQPVPRRDRRAPHALRAHRGARHRQHPRPVGLRTDPRARAAAGGRHVPPSAPPHDPRRVGDRGAPRRTGRDRPRAAVGLGVHPRAALGRASPRSTIPVVQLRGVRGPLDASPASSPPSPPPGGPLASTSSTPSPPSDAIASRLPPAREASRGGPGGPMNKSGREDPRCVS